MTEINLKTIEMHTGGAPVRILVSGLPEIAGKTILDKIQHIRDNHDYIRKLLIFEPRGHYDMYGVLLVEPDAEEADMGCIFIHNEGFSTMCGDAVIALGRYAVDYAIIRNPVSPETRVVFQCPCGPVEAFVEYKDGKTGNVRFNSVPSFVHDLDQEVAVPGYGTITVDIVYGGAFYALVPASRLGLNLQTTSVPELTYSASAVTDAVMKVVKLTHPENKDLAFLFGTILTDGNDECSMSVTRNMCVYGGKQVDRAPCGSAVTARVAQQFARGQIKLQQSRTFTGPVGSKFNAKVVRRLRYGSRDDAVVVEVSGRGHYTGTCHFTLEEDDDVGKGFLL